MGNLIRIELLPMPKFVAILFKMSKSFTIKMVFVCLFVLGGNRQLGDNAGSFIWWSFPGKSQITLDSVFF